MAPLRAPSCAFLLSRQHRLVTPRSFWLQATLAAARVFSARGLRLVAGEGLVPLDFSSWAFRRAGGRVEVVPRTGRGRASWADLDREVAGRADELVAVAVRKGGIMEDLGREALRRGARVHAVPPPPGEPGLEGNASLLEAGALPLPVDVARPLPRPLVVPAPASGAPPRSFLWHFTRSCPGPWPGESRDEWFRSLAENLPGAAHDARDTLGRMLGERKIRACARLIRGSFPVVCLTGEDPDRMIELKRYRPALLRWDFEPAALGIRRDAAARLGIRPVSYLPPAAFDSLPPEDRHLFQKHDPPVVDFTHEKEWRSLGDIDLSSVAESDLALWAPESA